MKILFVISLLVTIIMLIINGFWISFLGMFIQAIAAVFLSGSVSELIGGSIEKEA